MRILFCILLLMWLPIAAAAQGRLPDGGVAVGNGLRAWYVGPTDRYDHGILGDSIEAGGLAVEYDDETYYLDLPADSVFEDLTPRIVDADGDGVYEVLTIKSYLTKGATIALYGIRDGVLVALGEAPAIGTSHRWLNPAGVADYDGDGAVEIAVIETPHIGGQLVLYHWDPAAKTITEEGRTSGYSTHKIGTRALNLSVTVDWDGDGIPDLLLPSQDLKNLIALSMAGGVFKQVDSYKLRREVTSDIEMDGNFVKVPLRGFTKTFTRPYNAEEKRHKAERSAAQKTQ